MNDQVNTLQTLLASSRASDAERQRARGIVPLPLNPDEATAAILAAIAGNEALPADAFAVLAERNRALLDGTEEEVATSLARQVVVLESLFLSFSAKAAHAGRVDHMVGLSKAATNVHRALLAAQGALRQVTEDRRNVEAIEA
jgi:hypothetical protein